MTAAAWPFPRVLAHRGGGVLAPENTLAAIRVGRAHGYSAVEFDATLPRDDTPVLIHDATLTRTAGVRGRVADFSALELSRLDVGRWHSPRFAGEAVPQLGDVLRFCREAGVWANVEIKPSPGRDADTGRVVAEVVAASYKEFLRPGGATQPDALAQVPLLSSFSVDALRAAQRAAPDVPRGWLSDRIPPRWRSTFDELGCVALHLNHRFLTAAAVRQIKASGVWIFCFTVNDPLRARQLLSWGVDAFCTDRIDLIGPGFAAE